MHPHTPARLLPLLLALAPISQAWAAPADIIRALPAGGAWNQEVKKVVVSMFDTNGSGLLDTEAEVQEVGCDMWKAIDEGVRRDWRGATVLSVYGFTEGSFWGGGELGLAEGMRAKARSVMETCGISAAAPPSAPSVSPSSDPSATGPDISAEVDRIAPGDTTAWGNQVEALLVKAYDQDGSGTIQTLAELGAIPCPVWKSMEKGVTRDWSGTGLRVIYGFDPEFIWVGDAFSIDASLRTATVIATSSCGVGARLTEPGAAIEGLPEGGSTPWDTFVTRAMLQAWDADSSQSLDNEAEVRAVSCQTWSAMDKGVRSGWEGASIRQVYGFGPDLIWVGYAVGFDEKMRLLADAQAEGCGLAMDIRAPTASDVFAGPGRVSTATVVTSISNTPAGDGWDSAISQILNGAFDLNGSGAIDTSTEVKQITCPVWAALDRGVQGAWDGTGLRVIYGYKKDFIWVGYALGFDEKMRKIADKAAAGCGLL